VSEQDAPTAPPPAARSDGDARTHEGWWRTAVVYQIYPRSFADADGDGIGDLRGITSRLDYLAGLGIDAIWLTPFYPSPLADGGYDVSDHRDVDPRLGTLADFVTFVEGAHARGLRVMVDIVPNHTSDQHPWFLEALASPPGSQARSRYVFRDGVGPDGSRPPSDWRSHFGGSGWQRITEPDGSAGQWYLHLFAREQPDLNWDNPEIGQYFLDTLRFWADLGVDGFRVDVAHALAKDLSDPLRSQPNLDAELPPDGTDPLYDREEVHAIYRTWRKVLDEYDPPRPAVAETWTPTSSRTYLYARADELGQVFDFSLLKSPWDRGSYRRIIQQSLDDHHRYADDGGGLTWVLSSHDVPRHASRLALPPGVLLDAWLVSGGTEPPVDVEVGRRRARAATLMMLALPGAGYLYQGEELGLLEVADLPADALRDPIWERTAGALRGRDGCRVPIPWTADGPAFGFGTGTPWLPQPHWFGALCVAAQEHDPGSTMRLYRRALAVRRTLQTGDSAVTWLDDTAAEVLHLRRSNGWECVVNLGRRPVALPPGRLLLASEQGDWAARPGAAALLPPDAAAWLLAGPLDRRPDPRPAAG
jgi:alpha-glucosidase